MQTEDSNTSEQIALRKYCIEVAFKTEVRGTEVILAAHAIYNWIISGDPFMKCKECSDRT